MKAVTAPHLPLNFVTFDGHESGFFEDFLLRDELQTIRDGKRPADLLVRALQRAINGLPGPIST